MAIYILPIRIDVILCALQECMQIQIYLFAFFVILHVLLALKAQTCVYSVLKIIIVSQIQTILSYHNVLLYALQHIILNLSY